jgi:redox-sensitive bicupin YhaK (pirin superfamily)
MLSLRKAEERGHADHGWLDTHHTFSFGDYHDPRHMGFGPLRVLNDDTVAAGGGFPTHGHRDMEIISYVLEGALEHRDSLGTGSVIRPGDVQRMSAGRGVRHSEFNASRTEPVHFLQIWILPRAEGLAAGYEQKRFSEEDRRGKLRLVASPDGAEGSVSIQQDARMFATLVGAGQALSHPFDGKSGWVHLARGHATVNGTELSAGDGLAVQGETALSITSSSQGELLVFEWPEGLVEE